MRQLAAAAWEFSTLFFWQKGFWQKPKTVTELSTF